MTREDNSSLKLLLLGHSGFYGGDYPKGEIETISSSTVSWSEKDFLTEAFFGRS